MNTFYTFLINHLGFDTILGYVLICAINAMASPKVSEGVYAYIYRFTHLLTNMPAVQAFEAKHPTLEQKPQA